MKKYTYRLYTKPGEYFGFSGTERMDIEKIQFNGVLCLTNAGVMYNLRNIVKIEEVITDEQEGGEQ